MSQEHIGLSDTCTQCGKLADYSATGGQMCVKCNDLWNSLGERDYLDAEAERCGGQDEAWDCDPDAVVTIDAYDLDIDEEDDKGDWQIIALDRFGDRNINGRY